MLASVTAVAAATGVAHAAALGGAVTTVTNTAGSVTRGVQPPPLPTAPQVVQTVTNTVNSLSRPSHPSSSGAPPTSSGSGSSSSASPSGSASSGSPAASVAAGRGGGQPRTSSGGSGASGTGSGGSGASVSGRSAKRAARSRARAGATAAKATHLSSAARRPRRAAGDPALVRDIRTIVRVIPDPVKGLIAALIALAIGLAVRSRLTSRRARRLERQREDLLGDLGLLQRALLPELPTDLRSLDVSVAYRPADGPAAGGDFYDVFALDDRRTAIVVGDVMGHGREALAVTALMRYTLRAYLNAGFEPRIALKVAGRALAGDPDGELTTVVVAVHDAASGTLTYACAGHEPPIVVGPGEHPPVTFWSAPPLGGFMETGQRQTTISLTRESRVCLFTDGLVEARVGDGLMGREVLASLFADVDQADELLDRVAATAEHTRDDMAACVVRPRVSAPAGVGRRIEELELSSDELAAERLETYLAACSVAPDAVRAAAARARALISDGTGAVVRVTVDRDAATAQLFPRDAGPVAIPPVDEARRLARLVIPA